MEALEKVYGRLNVRFDEYDGESMYAASEEHTSHVLDLLEEKNLLQQLEDGREAEDSYHEDTPTFRLVSESFTFKGPIRLPK